MVMRPLLPVLAGLAIAMGAAPALAAKDSASPIGETMRDPVTQQRMASAVEAMSDALLDLRIAPLLRAIEAAEGGAPGEVDPDLALRDYAGPDAERVPRELSRRLPGMMEAFGAMAVAFEATLPAFAAAAETVRERWDEELGRSSPLDR